MSNIYYNCMRSRRNSNIYCGWPSLPDSDAGVMGHPTGHNSLGPFDDTLVLWWLSDAGSCCGHRRRLLLGDCGTEQSLLDLLSSFTQYLFEIG